MIEAAQKLTLPLKVGNKYVRRDGMVVTVTTGCDPDVVSVGDGNFVWMENGKVWLNPQHITALDIVADYVETTVVHPHAESMLEYAKDAAKMSEPWKNWEVRYNEGKNTIWYSCIDHPAWKIGYQYRRKQPKVIINGIECVAGVKTPVSDELYYVASLTRYEYYMTLRYTAAHKNYADRGLVHRTKEDAIAMAKAMLNFQ